MQPTKRVARMKHILGPARWVALICIFPAGLVAQETLTLRQAIQVALKQSPDIEAAGARGDEAKACAALARTQYLPEVSFTDDVARGNDPVYVFGTRLPHLRLTLT